MIINKNSGFWLGSDLTNRYTNTLTGVITKTADHSAFERVGHQRAIGNFVRIVTGQNIPVRFSTSDNSYTDGKSVVISGNIQSGNFDIAVGLALHEGSHIKLTDFNLLLNGIGQHISSQLYTTAMNKGITSDQLDGIVKNFLNIVEDRRIDSYIHRTARGYRGYYDEMYNNYFNDKVINKALNSRVWSTPTVEHYFNHVCNFTNEYRTLDLLPGLLDIWKTIDLKHIDRLLSTTDSLNVALKMTEIMLENLPVSVVNPDPDKENEGEGNDGNGNEGEGNEADGNDADGNDADGNDAGGNGNQPLKLSDKDIKAIENAIAKQKKFLNGNIKKSKISAKDKSSIDGIQSSDANVVNVPTSGAYASGNKNVAVIRKITSSTDNICDIYRTSNWRKTEADRNIANGIRMGTMLGKKLLIRNDDVKIQYNRQRKGKVDRRLLADLGVGNNTIFEQTYVTSARNASIHISIDASGSMGGDRWNKSITTAVAIAKACEVVGGIRVKIDTRSDCGNELTKQGPTVLVAYDSKINNMSHIKKYFPNLVATGGTPEGLCFRAIEDIINEGDKQTDKYFINISDGEPDHVGTIATVSIVKKMKSNNIKVLSYLIDNCDRMQTKNIFIKMYGKESASFIDTNNLMSVAKTLNTLLSKRGE